jgi:hypothetical protein
VGRADRVVGSNELRFTVVSEQAGHGRVQVRPITRRPSSPRRLVDPQWAADNGARLSLRASAELGAASAQGAVGLRSQSIRKLPRIYVGYEGLNSTDSWIAPESSMEAR